MIRRKGITLLEVLVAIFIMAIGLLALLTLFPVGALSMRQAIQDNRAAQAAVNAAAIANALDFRNDPSVTSNFNPGSALPPTWDGPSYPVYVDPADQVNVTLGSSSIRRTRPTWLSAPSQFIRWFSLLDDIEFDPSGSAVPPSSTVVPRANRFTWAYLIRRPRLNDPSVVELNVVVYNNRPLVAVSGEPTYSSAQGTAGSTSLQIDYTNMGKPPVRVGGWILDATFEGNVVNANTLHHGPVHCYFYRVVNMTDVSTTVVQVEVQPPLKATLTPGPNTKVVVMEAAAEVFDKGTGWKP